MTRTLPPAEPLDIGQVTESERAPYRDRPGFTAELVDVDVDGWHVYRISDLRGYTLAHDTVRIGARWAPADRSAEPEGIAQVWRREGWTDLLSWDDRPSALARVFRVLYGEEDHG